MKRKPGAIIAGILALSLLYLPSCRKDKSAPQPTSEARALLPGEAGSYWVYESYYVDSNENGDPGGFGGRQPALIDSFYMAADTMIRGETFHCLMRPYDIGAAASPWYFRDSASYLIDPAGNILIATSDTNRVFKRVSHPAEFMNGDSLALVTQYAGRGRIKQTPAGSFQTIAYVTEWLFHPFVHSGRAVHHYRTYIRFATGVGIVSESSPYWSSSPGQLERRLRRFHIVSK